VTVFYEFHFSFFKLSVYYCDILLCLCIFYTPLNFNALLYVRVLTAFLQCQELTGLGEKSATATTTTNTNNTNNNNNNNNNFTT
jgi:hypothetical protein